MKPSIFHTIMSVLMWGMALTELIRQGELVPVYVAIGLAFLGLARLNRKQGD